MISRFNLIFLAILIFLGSCTSAKDANIKETLEKYKQCLQNRNEQLIKEIADESFRFGVYQQPHSGNMFASFIKMAEAPDSVYWDEVQTDKDKTYCMVHYLFPNKKVSSTVTFSDKGRLIFSEWLDERGRNFKRNTPSKFVTSIPFCYKNGKLQVKAQLNNSAKELNMIFDTGADGMALRTDLQEECRIKIARNHTANVPGGQVQTKISEGNTLIFDSLRISDQNLVLFDNLTSKGIDGIIGGSNLFRDYIVELDFDKQLIRLYTHGKFTIPKNYQQCDMTYKDGVPTVPFLIYKNDKVFKSHFIFDTGAGYEAILFGSGFKELAKDSITKHIPALYHSYNYSIGHRSKIIIGQADSVNLANMTFEKVNLAMEPYNENNHGRHNILGSIGIKTLTRFNWIVDLTAYKIYSKPNHYTKLPMAFTINGFLFEYVGNHLKVMFPLNPDAKKNKQLLPGDDILMIDDIPAAKLTTEKIAQLASKDVLNMTIKRGENESTISFDNISKSQ